MKNQDKHPIDNYFKDYMDQDFPYNPSSWKKATMVIDAYFGKRKKSVLIIAFFLIASSIALFLAFNPKNKTTKSILTRQTYKETKNSNSFNEFEAKIENSNVANLAGQAKSSKANKLAQKSIEILENTVNEKTQIKEEIEEISARENQSDVSTSLITEIPDSSPVKEKSTFFTDFVLSSKSLYSFNFINSNKNPQPIIRKAERMKKFDFMIELETLFSSNTKRKLGGLTQDEMDYMNKYESVKNTNSYHLNLLFQHGRVALVAGLGYQNTIIKTDYLATHVSYDTKILYKTENKTAPASSGSYLIITTRLDTLGKRTDVSKIENQQDQTFKWLLIPLKILYQYPHKRFRFSMRTGVDLSWLYNAKGSFINSDLKSVSSIDTDELKRFNATMSAQFMTGYQINKRFQIGGSTYFNKQLGSNFKNYNSRFQNTGLGLYVRMGF